MGQYISSPSTPAPTAEDLRAQAIAAGDLRRRYSEQSQAAYRAGRGQEAKRLSELAKAQWAEAERLNSLAADLAFGNYNPSYPSTLTSTRHGGGWALLSWLGWGKVEGQKTKGLERLDLHGLYVAEAITRVEAHMRACKEYGVERTMLITGRGNRSVDGVAKIKPSVEKWLQERQAGFRVVKGSNDGAVTVELVQETTGLLSGVMKIFGW
ncbi:hypothetical protein FN846DRAFT_973855 [Sphaerosporella brunnea]|uniref:Smr domain-containing protein n=1 Tax=Sphaerosporella brunnea TaxID=1250544 RepID=A0A5J5EH87_9PEZI|nr:hypothetical protein FN846DRAFT_973855 [Sphaerosporella brunnea]